MVGNMYPPHSYGGYELVWRSAVEHLGRAGHKVRVLTTDTRTAAVDPDPPDVYRELHWHLHDGRFERLPLRSRVALARHNHHVLDRHLAAFDPEVVGWWSMGGLTMTLIESVRRRALPAVAFVHDEWLDYGRWVDPWLTLFAGRRRPARPFAERLLGIPTSVHLGKAATYVFVSESIRRHALGLGLGIADSRVAHSGIDPSFIDPAPAREWTWRLLYVGRIDPRKGVDTAVEALAHLPPEAQLEIVGGWDAREEQRLRELARRLGLSGRVRFTGHLDRSELPTLYAHADAVVFPVVWEEPWGLVPLEAMARGRPVVATGRGGSGEYLRDRENCVLFEAGDARSLSTAVRRLASDAELRRALRARGLKTASCYTEEQFNHAVEEAMVGRVDSGSALLGGERSAPALL